MDSICAANTLGEEPYRPPKESRPVQLKSSFQRFGAGNSIGFGRIGEDVRLILVEVLFREGCHEHPKNSGNPDEAFDFEAHDPQNGVFAPAIPASS